MYAFGGSSESCHILLINRMCSNSNWFLFARTSWRDGMSSFWVNVHFIEHAHVICYPFFSLSSFSVSRPISLHDISIESDMRSACAHIHFSSSSISSDFFIGQSVECVSSYWCILLFITLVAMEQNVQANRRTDFATLLCQWCRIQRSFAREIKWHWAK